MNVLLFGGTGFVGKRLVHALTRRNHHIYIVTRTSETYQNEENITFISYDEPVNSLPVFEVVINLAGESLFGYWTTRKKERILQSRIMTTNKAVKVIREMEQKPKVFINSSAVGFYGTSEKKIFSEKTTKPGDDFLAQVVTKWEEVAREVEQLNVRTVYSRFGLILGSGGSLPLMSLPIKMFVGGKIGNGRQWISWIHIDDVVALILHCIDHEQIHGPVNFTSPNPMQNKEFIQAIAKVLKRPVYFPIPALLMKLVMGEMSELITKGQYVLPERAKKFDYVFKYPKIDEALHNIFQK